MALPRGCLVSFQLTFAVHHGRCIGPTGNLGRRSVDVANVASLIGRLGSSAFKPSATTFQTIHYCSVDVAHGLALLFGIGTKALPLWDSRTRRNNLLGDLVGRPCRQSDSRFKRHYELTSSIVPRGTSFHGLVELEFSPIVFDPARFSCCCRGLFPGPAELSAINPYAVHDHGQPTRQRHD